MKIISIIVDNSTAVLSWLTSLFGMMTLLGFIHLDDKQTAGVMLFAGATIGLLSVSVTTAKRKVVAVVDSSGTIRAGQGSTADTGTPTPVARDESGNLVPQVAVKPSLLDAA